MLHRFTYVKNITTFDVFLRGDLIHIASFCEHYMHPEYPLLINASRFRISYMTHALGTCHDLFLACNLIMFLM